MVLKINLHKELNSESLSSQTLMSSVAPIQTLRQSYVGSVIQHETDCKFSSVALVIPLTL